MGALTIGRYVARSEVLQDPLGEAVFSRKMREKSYFLVRPSGPIRTAAWGLEFTSMHEVVSFWM